MERLEMLGDSGVGHDKVVSAKNIVASKLGYDKKDQAQSQSPNESREDQNTTKARWLVSNFGAKGLSIVPLLTPEADLWSGVVDGYSPFRLKDLNSGCWRFDGNGRMPWLTKAKCCFSLGSKPLEMASNNKMKGLLKGLRYISEIFENEKEPEMQIGLPTDVKHVAHIGWDGPSAVKSAPSWMNEFKSSPANNCEAREEDPRRSVSQDEVNVEGSRSRSSSATDMAEVPKSSKRSSNSSTGESTGKEKSDKPKHSKKSTKTTSSSKETSENPTKPKKKPKEPKEHKEPKEPNDPTDSDKKSRRRKKSKDCAEGSSRRSRTRDLDNGSDSGSVAGIREDRLSGSGFDEGEF
ncbi:CRIB domain-containing protein RIC7 [Hibiscus syriacus]|uniref:CRIB domain-containing protein RIC7 n=1 Tax=Hibiscus syriacus TaxID=106335 RepID=A0A6A2XZX9_HIBSY|nr:CRIB domain-containing protein RIC7 [Hibiscus syriacus]